MRMAWSDEAFARHHDVVKGSRRHDDGSIRWLR